jgi:hypothetical protein
MFEALRRLRDAVAPESGNLGVSHGNQQPLQDSQAAAASPSASSEPENTDELWNLYRSGDGEVVARVHRATRGVPVQKRDEFVRVHAKLEMEKDAELVSSLAASVLQRSAEIDGMVDSLPGMNRTREEQMRIIEGLISLNREAAQELEDAHAAATERQAACRAFVQRHTCEALGIDEPDRFHDGE